MHLYSGGSHHRFFNAVILALSLISAGCSFSRSSESFSDSVESFSDSSKSISDSISSSSKSSDSDKDKKYENEVSDYTMAYVKSSQADADYKAFQKGLSDIAARKGIVNWNQDPKTYVAIGKGLKKAGVEGVSYETYKKNFANADQENMRHIQKGYESKK